MALEPGTRLGPYDVVAKLGEGGMGEVYRARDTVLDRNVALKILPEAFASDPDRLMRFEREAKTLATLNHPNIAHIHGLEVSGGTRALVMELVEGDDLSQRLARGPLPTDDVVPIALQVAEALEAAHEQGIIHRDLKPANIKVRDDGTVKVLDFGLAKALDSGPGTNSGPGTGDAGPTMTSPALTQIGVILGTAAYMAPEQARGRAVDRRADIWAFGCVLYEMLTGRRAFAGDELTDVIAAVVTRDPDLSALPAATPPHVRALLARCFVKDPKQRLRDMGEARLQLTGATPAVIPGASPSLAPSSRSWAVPVLAVLLVGALATVATLLWRDGNRPVMRSTHVSLTFLDTPQPQKGRPIPSLAVSPDGRSIVYTARGPEGNQLWIRSLDGFKGTPIPGTVNGRAPAFSPDGRWIAYQAQGIMKISTAFDRPIVVAQPGTLVNGLTWTDRDDIVFGTVQADALWRVPASGGTPVKVADGYFAWPSALPGGAAVVATVSSDAATSSDGLTIARIDLETGALTKLLDGGTYARWVPGGYLAFVRANSLIATTYDPSTNALGETRATLAEDLFMDPATSSGCYAVSPAGVLVFCPGGGIDFDRTIVAIDPARPGTTPASVVDRARYYDSALAASPDGRFVAAVERGWHDRIVVIDLERRTSFYLTAQAPRESQVSPVWSPDGRTIAYREGRRILKTEVGDGGSGTPDMLVENVGDRRRLYLTAWTPDGRSLIADDAGAAVVRITPGQAPPFETLVDNAGAGVFSPNGRWLAVHSSRSGRSEVYLAPAANPRALVRVSLDSGGVPLWAPRGDRLYFQGPGPSAARVIMAVSVGSGAEPQVGRPMQVAVVAGVEPSVSVAPLPDGRLLAIKGSHMADAPELRVVLNWFDELKAKVK